MKLVCMSDTHNRQGQFPVPDGDVVVHAGDLGLSGSLEEVRSFAAWFGKLPHVHKILTPGNHDWAFQNYPEEARKIVENAGIILLIDQEVTVAGLRIYGSPYQPEFFNWAFNVPRGPELAAIWAKIPTGIDVLITHGPPKGILDFIPRGKQHVGCEDLLEALKRGKPRLHVYGHIHESYGQIKIGNTQFVNASVCDGRYRPVNGVQVIELS